MNIKTTLHYYRFDISKEAELSAFKDLETRLRERGYRCFRVLGSASGVAHRDFLNSIKKLDGGPVELETQFLFDNQWNTAPAAGIAEKGLRVMDWHEWIYPNKNIKEGYYLEKTAEMQEIRRNTVKCGYCGAMEPAAKGYVFCPHCLDSAYLSEGDLHLTRLLPVADGRANRPPLTEAEKGYLMPLYIKAQTTGANSRAKKTSDARRRKVIVKARAQITNARTERDGMLWLHAAGFNIDNVIYYSHNGGRFGFGWRRPLGEAELSAVLGIISEFPFPYSIQCDDGRELSGD